MKRTQLYLNDSLFEKLKKMGQKENKTISELVREGLEKAYFSVKQSEALETIRGLWGDRKLDTARYIRSLREDRRTRLPHLR